MNNFYNSLRIQSYNAFLNFIVGARNLGKTWSFKIRAYKRFMRRGRKTIWVRRFKHEAKETAATFFTGKLRRKLRLTDDNFKMQGRKAYAMRNGKWECFLNVVYLSESRALRSAEDSAVDTIIFDEFTATPDRYVLYRGDEVADFIDLVMTVRRTNEELKVFFLGNKETATASPYFTYLKIPSPELNFSGIRSYKNGSIAIEIRDDIPEPVRNSYAHKVADALSGTAYYAYLTDGKSKSAPCNVQKCPKSARKVLQVDFIGACSLWANADKLYVKTGADKSLLTFVNGDDKKYIKKRIYHPTDKKVLSFIVDAYKRGNLFYNDEKAFEFFSPFFERVL